jgi:lactoylglutathione lyase/glyoxylase I family protein
MITGLHHTALSVRDLDAAIGFFTCEAAFSLQSRFTLADTVAHRAMLQLGDATARGALLQSSLGCLVLLEFAGAAEADAPGREVHAAGIRHICLQTAISDHLYDALLKAGATARARPSGLGTGNSYVYIRDPEGNLIELEGVPWAPDDAVRPWYAHTAVVTPDIERLTGFYAMLTGVDIHARGRFGPDAKFDRVGGFSQGQFHGAWLRLPNAELEFWQYVHPATTPVARRSAAAPGWSYLCFESDDIAADHARLTAHGAELHGPPEDFVDTRGFFGRDPDGNIFAVQQAGAVPSIAAMLAESQGRSIDAARTAYRCAQALPVPPRIDPA